VVFVAVHGTPVDLTGAVRRPATYELKAGETLVDLIGAAGGFRPRRRGSGSNFHGLCRRRAVGRRRRRGWRSTFRWPLACRPGFALEDGDVVQVDALADAHGRVTCSGHGWWQAGGPLSLAPGMTIAPS